MIHLHYHIFVGTHCIPIHFLHGPASPSTYHQDNHVQQHIPGLFTTISSVLPQGFSDTKAQGVGTNSLSAQGCTTQSPADFEQGLKQESFPGGPDGGASCATT